MNAAFPCLGLALASAVMAHAETIPVTKDNFAQAETAWNFANWAARGADQGMLHLREVSPAGDAAPTVRMNWDTLYSVQIVKPDEDGAFTVTLPESDLYVSAQVMDTDGFSPYFIVEPGHHDLSVSTDYALIIFRTELKDRKDAAGLAHLHAVQDEIAVSGGLADSTYVPPDYDQAQLEALRIAYKEEFLNSGSDFVYAKGPGAADQHVLDLSHAAGWGGYPPELGVSNAYSSSKNIPGDQCHAITFDDPENAFFTSFTLYDVTGYLMPGETHINSNMWVPNADGTVTLHFNCGAERVNNLTSGGAAFNYSIRNYGASQAVIDGEFRPIDPKPVSD